MTDTDTVIHLPSRPAPRTKGAPPAMRNGQTLAHRLVSLAIERARQEGGVALITGASGTGKTTAAQDAIEDARRQGCNAHHIYVRTALQELREGQRFLLHELGIYVEKERQTPAYELQRALEDHRFQDDTLIVIDEAHQATNQFLGVIRDFVDQRHRHGEPVAVVLIGSPALRGRIMSNPDPRFDLASLAGRLVIDAQVHDPTDEDFEAILRESVGLVGREAVAIARAAAKDPTRLRRLARLLREARHLAGSRSIGIQHLRDAALRIGVAE